jgi:hypothetical protein
MDKGPVDGSGTSADPQHFAPVARKLRILLRRIASRDVVISIDFGCDGFEQAADVGNSPRRPASVWAQIAHWGRRETGVSLTAV